MMPKLFDTISVQPTTPHLGAEISGVDLGDLDDRQFNEIRQAFVDHGVIFFHGQELTPDQHIEFAKRWGQINVNRFFHPVDGYPQIAEVRKEPHQKASIGSSWHTDHSYDQIPAMGSILYAREVPTHGGDTMFASMYAAYEGLAEDMKTTLSTMNARHTNRIAFGRLDQLDQQAKDDLGNRLNNPHLAVQDAVHPVVIRHPLSGRPALFVNKGFTVSFDGLADDESAALLDQLEDHCHQEQYTYRFSWKVGSIAIWDNRATHHMAINDYDGQRRLMHRITIEGDPLTRA